MQTYSLNRSTLTSVSVPCYIYYQRLHNTHQWNGWSKGKKRIALITMPIPPGSGENHWTSSPVETASSLIHFGHWPSQLLQGTHASSTNVWSLHPLHTQHNSMTYCIITQTLPFSVLTLIIGQQERHFVKSHIRTTAKKFTSWGFGLN